jgi:spermidine synthase
LDESQPVAMDPIGLLPCLLLLVSGGLALVYELLWMRRFVVVFGATTPAVSATLVAIFLGFAVGSAVLGARAARFANPLRTYGLLEIAAGLSALLVEPMLWLYDLIYPAFYGALSGSVVGFLAVKTLLAVLALFAPTFFMGATVPVLSQAFDRERRRLGISAGGLYAANTLGAVAGALSVPFFWLPKLGAPASYGACVASSILVGTAACWLSRGKPVSRESRADHTHEELPRSVAQTSRAQRCGEVYPLPAVVALAALSGILMLVLQVTQGRMFAQIHENSIYSYSVVLALFLAALAGGAALARECLRRGASTRLTLAVAWNAGGLAVFASPHLFYALTDGLAYLKGGGGWVSYGANVVWLGVPTVLLPTLLSGMVLPLLMDLAGTGSARPAGRVLGGLLAVNTAGAIGGALLGAFVCPRWLGLWGTLAGTGIAMIVAGAACSGPLRRALPVVFSASGLAVALLLVWNPARLPEVRIRGQKGEKVVALHESSYGIVAVTDAGGDQRIKLDNFYVLGGTASTGDERMQAHVPLLLHPAPRRVAFLGLGTGITAGAALLHPVERVTVLEIVPDVVAVARDHFRIANLGVVQDRRVECVVEDGRNFLRATERKFDVIVGDLFVPWRRGEAGMFSLDQFASARRVLAPGGIFCQWLPMFQMSEEEFNIVAATFLDIFPQTTLWRGDLAPDLPGVALVGHTDDAPIDPAVVDRRVRELRTDETNLHLAHAAGLWMFLVGPLDAKAARFANARRNREGTPWLELLGPLTHAGSIHGREPLFVGRRLESFLGEISKQSLAGSPLARLDAEHLRWRDAGARLRQGTLLMAEGKQAEAQMQEAAAALPSTVQQALLGTNAPPR